MSTTKVFTDPDDDIEEPEYEQAPDNVTESPTYSHKAPECLPYTNAFTFATALGLFPYNPYRWQVEMLLQLSGYPDPYDLNHPPIRPYKEAPLRANLCAANGSGKDQIVLAIWALFCLTCRPNFKWIATSASAEQLDSQTWKHIKESAKIIKAKLGSKYLRVTKYNITCAKTGSSVKLFRSDEGKLTEGFHPDVSDGEMALVLNECKSLDQEVIDAFKRCHGYTHWLNISSPGAPLGYFYERCTYPETVWPAPLVYNLQYFRRITVYDCPHLLAEFNNDLKDEDIASPYIRSSYLAEFTATGMEYVVPAEAFMYVPTIKLKIPRRAGIDLSLGGDQTVVAIWEDNRCIEYIEYQIRHEPTLTRQLCVDLEKWGLKDGPINADAGGLGASIIHRMQEAGFNVTAVHNQGAALQPKKYRNRVAEMAMRFRRLILDKVLDPKTISPKTKKQASRRMFFYKEGKTQLEDKKAFKKRYGMSPDHFDADLLANAHTDFPAPKRGTEDAMRHVRQALEDTYGSHSTRRQQPTSGLYRTSGVRREKAHLPY